MQRHGILRSLHPFNAILLAFPLALFTGAMVSDFAYHASLHVQWANFSSWLLAGGLLVGGFAVLWALIDLIRPYGRRGSRLVLYVIVLVLMWAVGLVGAFVHAKDAWAAMPEGLYLSAAATLLALIAAWIGYSGLPGGEVR